MSEGSAAGGRAARRSLLVALALAGMAATGCGGGDEASYREEYGKLNSRLLVVGEKIGRAPLEAARESNASLQRRFGAYAAELEGVGEEVADLDAPEELEAESVALTSSIRAVVKDLDAIADAAKRGDTRAATAATVALGADSDGVNRAQNRLARATGADVGPR